MPLRVLTQSMPIVAPNLNPTLLAVARHDEAVHSAPMRFACCQTPLFEPVAAGCRTADEGLACHTRTGRIEEETLSTHIHRLVRAR
jgi:hypothetical protein